MLTDAALLTSGRRTLELEGQAVSQLAERLGESFSRRMPSHTRNPGQDYCYRHGKIRAYRA